ncbi:MAG: glycerophosphodiester phosphodiesterase [Planctomycetales bacterium]|nr:glycerophosphodiester phosphodiesterase [Planctomycetales bacterium]
MTAIRLLSVVLWINTLTQFSYSQHVPIVIAHRGASGYLAEHTEGAKVLAIAQGADFVEQDLVLTRDRVFVVSHDTQLDHISNVATRFPDRHREDGHYYFADFDWPEIRTLSIVERSLFQQAESTRFPSRIDQRFLRLEDEIQLVHGLNQTLNKQVGFYMELKSPAWHKQEFGVRMSDLLLPILSEYGLTGPNNRCFIQCFEPAELQYLKFDLGCKLPLIQLMGNQPLGLGKPAGSDAAIGDRQLIADLLEVGKYAHGIGPSLNSLVAPSESNAIESSGLVETARSMKLQVHPYTVRVDSLPTWARSVDHLHSILLDELKVDGFFTDFPDTGRQAVDKRK